MYFTYVLFSQKLRRHYIGSTENIIRRLKEHNSGKSTFSKKGIPWQLVYQEQFIERKEAYKRENEIKSYKGGLQFKELLTRGEV